MTTRLQIDETKEVDVWLCTKPWWIELILVMVTAVTPGLPSLRFVVWAFRDRPVSGVAEDEEGAMAGAAKVAAAFMMLLVQLTVLGMLAAAVLGG